MATDMRESTNQGSPVKLAVSHFLAAVLAAALFVFVREKCGSVLYVFSLVVLFVFAVVTGLGVLRRSPRSMAWSVVMPFAVLPLWITPGWIIAEIVDFAAHGFEGTHTDTPGELLFYAVVAGLILLPFWLVISILYWRALRRLRAWSVTSSESQPKWTAVWVGVAVVAALVLLVNLRAGDGQMLIHNAAAGGRTGVVRVLVGFGQDVNKATDTRWTPLHYAASNGRLDTAEYLLSHGADINAKNADGSTAAILAAYGPGGHVIDPSGDHRGVLMLLAKRGADLKPRDSYERTAVIAGMPYGSGYDEQLVHALVEHGAPVNVEDRAGRSLVSHAVEYGKVEEVEYLLAHGGKLKPEYVFHADKKMLLHLFGKGLDVNTRSDAGDTLLHRAVDIGDTEMAKFLLAHGADPNIRNNTGKTALDMAREQKLWEVIGVIEGSR